MASWMLFLIPSLLILPSCFSAQCSDGGCFPPVGDLTIGRNVMTESQCSDTYCTPDNGTTANCSSYTSTLINDDEAFTHWVSAVGSELELPQIIQIELEDSMLFYSTEIVWQSPTPAAVVLERSTDFGETWIPYRYWADDCMESFGLNASTTLDGFGGEEAICTQLQQNILPGTKVWPVIIILKGPPPNSLIKCHCDIKPVTPNPLTLTSCLIQNLAVCFEFMEINVMHLNPSPLMS